jgi:hypothetical protein
LFFGLRRLLMLLCALPLAVFAQPEADLAARARASMADATRFLSSIATEGGYLWRYSIDLKHRSGEGKATESQVWVQPPGGTPGLGLAFLAAYRATGDRIHLDAARRAADALRRGQLESGGWDYMIDFDPVQARRWYRRSDAGVVDAAEAAKRRNRSSYDDNQTQHAILFLLEYCDRVGQDADAQDKAICAARDVALDKLVQAQYPNGAWPQSWDGRPRGPSGASPARARFPKVVAAEYPKKDYRDHYTLNDDAHRDLVLVLLDAHRLTGRKDCLQAALRGGDFIVAAQLPEPQPAWAQQYNADFEPDWARIFEPPAVASRESIGAMRTLMDLYRYTGDERWLAPIPSAMAWLERSALAKERWARFYELRSNEPVYGDGDGRIHRRLESISDGRAKGYAWQGSYGYATMARQWREIQDGTPRPRPPSATQRAQQAQKRRPKVEQVINAQDELGRWIVPGSVIGAPPLPEGVLDMGVFAAHLRALAEYVELVR